MAFSSSTAILVVVLAVLAAIVSVLQVRMIEQLNVREEFKARFSKVKWGWKHLVFGLLFLAFFLILPASFPQYSTELMAIALGVLVGIGATVYQDRKGLMSSDTGQGIKFLSLEVMFWIILCAIGWISSR